MSSMVGVLLPVRIETAFDEHPGGCLLRIIVIPDSPWVDRHDDTVRPAEIDQLDQALAACGGDWASEAGETAFLQMARALGGARAAWLIRTFPPTGDGTRADRSGARPRETPRGNIIRDLPDTIEIWASVLQPLPAPPVPVRLETLHPTSKRLRIELDENAVAVDGNEEIFRPSWEAAKGAGLTAVLELADLGIEPKDIDVLYAIGMGEADPAGLFEAHRDAGLLSILQAGVPTNSVAGGAAADLGRDDASWLRTVRASGPRHEEGLLSELLTTRSERLRPLYAPPRSGKGDPLGDEPLPFLGQQARTQALIGALWPALWGANAKDVWGIDAYDTDFAPRLGAWARQSLYPEGALPPIRIGNQPYGVLAVTSLSRWDGAGDEQMVEKQMVPHLIAARDIWSRAGEEGGTVDGANAEQLLDLISRLPVSRHLSFTVQLPLEVMQYWLSGSATPGQIADWWRKHADLPLALRGGEPERAFVQMLEQADIPIPLVEPPKPGDVPWREGDGRSEFGRALDWFINNYGLGFRNTFYENMSEYGLPESLLFRLIVHSTAIATSEVVRTVKGYKGPVTMTEGRLLERLDTGAAPGIFPGSVQDEQLGTLWHMLRPLSYEDPRILERSFLSLLDAASHRIDPWISGLAWRRLSASPYREERRRLGAYGWVDRPYRGKRGPATTGLLLAPSAAQASAAVILRDKAVYDPEPAEGALPGTRRWDMSLNSSRIRLASRIAGEVRMGAHIGEVLGREVERIIGSKASIQLLRDKYRLHSANQGRRTCDGEQVLDRTAAQLEAETGIRLLGRQEEEFEALREAVDAYSDLLVADAVFDVVSGRGDTAGAAMEAAAGLDLPPDLDVIRTPRAGTALTSILIAALPAGGEVPDDDSSPVWLAEPALAAFVTGGFPKASEWEWTREDHAAAADGTMKNESFKVTLEELGLEPVDLILIDPDQLAGLVIARKAPDWPAAQPKVLLTGSGPELHERLLRTVATFAGSPAMPSSLAVEAHEFDDGQDKDARQKLWDRFAAVRSEASELQQELENLAKNATSASEGGELLKRAQRWGIAPNAADEEAAGPLELRKHVLGLAAKVMNERLERAPKDPVPADELSASKIGEAMAGLLAPGGKLPIFSRLRRSQLGSIGGGKAAGLSEEPEVPMTFGGPDPQSLNRLDLGWLQTMAAVRASAARLEAYQLEALVKRWPVLGASTNWPDNPWREKLPPRPMEEGPIPGLLVAYAPRGTIAEQLDEEHDELLAVMLIDSWTETIPSAGHGVTAAFGFNAPAARAPQSILVAVTPEDGVPIDTPMLLDIVSETRQLVHARMASPAELQPLAAALPFTLVQSRYADPAGLELAEWEVQ